MRDNFWLPPAPEITHEPLTAAAIAEAEQQLGVKLPASYLEILTAQNGGYLRYDTYPVDLPNAWAEDHVPVHQLMGIGPTNSILESPRWSREWHLPDNLVLLYNHGVYWVTLDYRESGPQGEPGVVWFDTRNKQEIKLADNFDQFLAGLVHGYHCHVYGFTDVGENLTGLLNSLTNSFGVLFKKGVTGTSYYAYHDDWKALDNHSRATLLVMANRSAEGHYRYPNYPECQWLLICNISKDKGEIAEDLLTTVPFQSNTIHVPPWQRW